MREEGYCKVKHMKTMGKIKKILRNIRISLWRTDQEIWDSTVNEVNTLINDSDFEEIGDKITF